MSLDFNEIKRESEETLKNFGASINPALLLIDYQGVRSRDEIIKRVTIMAGMVYIAYKAPPMVIKEWIEKQGIYEDVTEFEEAILEKSESEITLEDELKLRWYVDSLWALVWVLGINDNFKIDEPVGDTLIQMVPDIRKKEDISKLKETTMRNEQDIYRQVDLYYRLHWYCVDSRLKGLKQFKFDEGAIMERRRALEWGVAPDEEWDEIELST